MPGDESKTGNVTIYKLKLMINLGVAKVPDCKEVAKGKDHATGYGYSLWTINPPPKKPNWFNPFRSLTATEPETRTAGMIFLVNTQDSSYAFVGGIGRHKLVKGFEIEPRFGINIAKRIIRKITVLKGLAQRDVGGSVHTIERSFRGNYDPKRDIDNLHRILRRMRASFDKEDQVHEEIGSSISASDSLSVSGSKDFAGMLRFLKKVDELSKSTELCVAIPDLREINKRTEKKLIDQLQWALVKEILKFRANKNKDQMPDLFLDNYEVGFLPDRVRNYTVIYDNSSVHESQEAVFERLAEILEMPLGDDEGGARQVRLSKIKVSIRLDDGVEAGPFHLMELMCGDVPFENESYFVDSGAWYKADEAYIDQLNEELANVPYVFPETLGLHEWTKGAELDYNKSHEGPTFIVLDCHLVRVSSEKGGVEFCDLMTKDKTNPRLIHVKRATGAELRALFAQGCVSAELYAYNSEFQDNVHNAHMDASEKLNSGDKDVLAALRTIPNANKCIVYAIADNTPGHASKHGGSSTVTDILDGTLSLFAKVDLFRRVRTIRELGMQVAVTRIKPYPKRLK